MTADAYRVKALNVGCPICGAKPGEDCRTEGETHGPHTERETAAQPNVPTGVHDAEKVYVGRRRAMTVEDWLELGWAQDDAERLAHEPKLDGSPQARTEVLIITASGVEELEHHVRHSPTGFEWGYAGSGPAELARCILIDFLGLHEQVRKDKDAALGVSYQDYKFEVIAHLGHERPWRITSEELGRWVERHRQAGPGGGPLLRVP